MKQINKNITIGFAEKFYTLWIVETFKQKVVDQGFLLGYQYYQKFTYCQNLSFDKAKAIEKAKFLMSCEEVVVDESLRGTSSFEVESDFEWDLTGSAKVVDWTKTPILRESYIPAGLNMLQLGTYVDPHDIKSTWIDDVRPLGCEFYRRKKENWQDVQKLWSIYNFFTVDAYLQGYDKEEGFNVFNQPGTFLYRERHYPSKNLKDKHNNYVLSPNPRHAVIARRRLVALGELVKFEGNYISMDDYCREIKKRDVNNRHHYNEGDRVTLDLTLVDIKGYETYYGWNTLQFFKDNQDRTFMYSGTSPKNIEIGQTVEVTATIKHNVYKDEKQTLISRMKVKSLDSVKLI